MLNVARVGPVNHGSWCRPLIPSSASATSPVAHSLTPNRRQLGLRVLPLADGGRSRLAGAFAKPGQRPSACLVGFAPAPSPPHPLRRAVVATAAPKPPPDTASSGAADFEDDPEEFGEYGEDLEYEEDLDSSPPPLGVTESTPGSKPPPGVRPGAPPGPSRPLRDIDYGDDDAGFYGEEEEGEFDEDEDEDAHLDAEAAEQGDSPELYEAFVRGLAAGRMEPPPPGTAAPPLRDMQDGGQASFRSGFASTSGRGESPDEEDMRYEEDYPEGEEGEEEEEEEEEEEDKRPPWSPEFNVPPKRSYILHELFAKAMMLDLAARLDRTHPNLKVSGLQTDALKVKRGDIFFYMPMPEDEFSHDERHHLPLEIVTALANGASAVVIPRVVLPLPEGCVVPEHVPLLTVLDVEHVAQQLAVAFYDAPARDLTVIAVAGSYGKTTVSWMVRGILEQLDQAVGMIGSIEYALSEVRMDVDGDEWRPDEVDPIKAQARECSAPFMLSPYTGRYTIPATTPQGLHQQKLLAGMRDRGAGVAIVECSSQALARNYCQWLQVKVVVWTNLSASGGSAELLGELGDRDKVFQAQMELFDKLDDPQNQVAIINLDDEASSLVLARAGGVPIVTYAVEDQTADVVLQTVTHNLWETVMVIRTPRPTPMEKHGRLQIITSLMGRHNVYNVLAAVATGIALGASLKAIVAGIEQVDEIPGRCQIIDLGPEHSLFPVIVDAASTPEALITTIEGVRAAGAKRIFTVFGCPGEQDRAQRAGMMEAAHRLSDYVILTNDSPRREDPAEIISDIVGGLPESLIFKYTSYVYSPFQDQGYVPLWFEPYLQKAQQTTKRYVMEDRFSAIRAAIGTANAGDAVIIAGRGHLDYVEHGDDTGGQVLRGWFDDRMEVVHALKKLHLLNGIPKLERKSLPWGNTLDEMDTLKTLDLINKQV